MERERGPEKERRKAEGETEQRAGQVIMVSHSLGPLVKIFTRGQRLVHLRPPTEFGQGIWRSEGALCAYLLGPHADFTVSQMRTEALSEGE